MSSSDAGGWADHGMLRCPRRDSSAATNQASSSGFARTTVVETSARAARARASNAGPSSAGQSRSASSSTTTPPTPPSFRAANSTARSISPLRTMRWRLMRSGGSTWIAGTTRRARTPKLAVSPCPSTIAASRRAASLPIEEAKLIGVAGVRRFRWLDLPLAQQLPRGVEAVPQSGARSSVDLAHHGSSVHHVDRTNLGVGQSGVIEQLGAVCRDEHLHVVRRGTKGLEQHLGGPRMDRRFWLFDADQRDASGPVHGCLVNGHEDAERAQRPVGHARGKEPPGIFVALDALAELERLLGAQRLGLHAHHPRHHRAQLLGNPVQDGLTAGASHLAQDRGDVAAVPSQLLSGVDVLQIANVLGVQVVESHAGKRIVDGSERGQRGDGHQREPVRLDDALDALGGAAYRAPFHVKEVFVGQRPRRGNFAVLALHREGAALFGGYRESVSGGPSRSARWRASPKCVGCPRDRRRTFAILPRSRSACSNVVVSASVTKRNASKKLLFPAPFGPTNSVSGASSTSHAAMLL